ncbi:hypothetical protein RF11_13010 [Thelohanellus kitauei]|uniref:Uncharacterized protein n=1 Tax=Thelohanellus kitauei TaxID=669202 RepID=A0A0C2J573_THEKT|nr:hypothetical protein RF11_13010 [Thelohanellus kitauei]
MDVTDLDNSEISASTYERRSSEFKIHMENRFGSWCLLICKIRDDETEIEIYGCNILFSTQNGRPILKHSIGYRLKFSKYTKYDLKKHKFMFDLDTTGDKTLEIYVHDLLVQFECFNRKCEFEGNFVDNDVPIDMDQLFYPCENFRAGYSYTNDVCEIFKPDTSRPDNNPPWYMIYIAIISIIFMAAFILVYFCRKRRAKSMKVSTEQD